MGYPRREFSSKAQAGNACEHYIPVVRDSVSSSWATLRVPPSRVQGAAARMGQSQSAHAPCPTLEVLTHPRSRLWGHGRNVPAGSRRRARGPCVQRQAAKAAPRPGGVYGGPGREWGPAPRGQRVAAAATAAVAAATVAATAGRAAWPWWRRPPALTCRAPGRGRREERGASGLSAAKVVRAAGGRRRPWCCHTPISPGGSRGGRAAPPRLTSPAPRRGPGAGRGQEEGGGGLGLPCELTKPPGGLMESPATFVTGPTTWSIALAFGEMELGGTFPVL